MIIHQLSVFLENRSGRLTEVLEVLGKENIRIKALSVADTSEFGILRLIVTEPQKAKDLLKREMFTVNITEVIAVMIPNEAATYASILKILSDLEISVEYTYAFSPGSTSVLILRCNNNEEAIRALKDNNLNLMKADDLYAL